jgi:hypothetical protein
LWVSSRPAEVQVRGSLCRHCGCRGSGCLGRAAPHGALVVRQCAPRRARMRQTVGGRVASESVRVYLLPRLTEGTPRLRPMEEPWSSRY